MEASRKTLEEELDRYGEKLKELNSYITELNDKTAKYGTDSSQVEEDLLEAGQNIKYYEGAIARIKQEMGKLPEEERPPQTGTDTILPRTVKQGAGSFIFSVISFVAGALLGSKLKSRKGSKDEAEEKRES